MRMDEAVNSPRMSSLFSSLRNTSALCWTLLGSARSSSSHRTSPLPGAKPPVCRRAIASSPRSLLRAARYTFAPRCANFRTIEKPMPLLQHFKSAVEIRTGKLARTRMHVYVLCASDDDDFTDKVYPMMFGREIGKSQASANALAKKSGGIHRRIERSERTRRLDPVFYVADLPSPRAVMKTGWPFSALMRHLLSCFGLLGGELGGQYLDTAVLEEEINRRDPDILTALWVMTHAGANLSTGVERLTCGLGDAWRAGETADIHMKMDPRTVVTRLILRP